MKPTGSWTTIGCSPPVIVTRIGPPRTEHLCRCIMTGRKGINRIPTLIILMVDAAAAVADIVTNRAVDPDANIVNLAGLRRTCYHLCWVDWLRWDWPLDIQMMIALHGRIDTGPAIAIEIETVTVTVTAIVTPITIVTGMMSTVDTGVDVATSVHLATTTRKRRSVPMITVAHAAAGVGLRSEGSRPMTRIVRTLSVNPGVGAVVARATVTTRAGRSPTTTNLKGANAEWWWWIRHGRRSRKPRRRGFSRRRATSSPKTRIRSEKAWRL